jgi:hypothetical protein
MTWQPIATAPKDRKVLLYFPRDNIGVECGQWNKDEYAKRPRPYWMGDCWRLWGVAAYRGLQPTHWMPLPEPPAGEECPA